MTLATTFLTDTASLIDLRGQTAVVTGGARGIGQGVAFRLAAAGASVVIADLDEELARLAAFDLAADGFSATGVGVDVADSESIQTMVEATVRSHGRLDILVNNAGVFPFSPVLDTSEALWDRVLDINLKGVFFASQAAARQMVSEGHGGRIVNIASIDALHPTGGLAHYDASKGGVVMLTRAIALELGPLGIRVNAIAPGSIQTPGAAAAGGARPAGMDLEQTMKAFLDRIPLGRIGVPDDIARAVLFFASSMSDYATGALLVVDGGYLLS
jgi:2-dehydro-3-deoxy-D-gluconate 5-dehydrogenase